MTLVFGEEMDPTVFVSAECGEIVDGWLATPKEVTFHLHSEAEQRADVEEKYGRPVRRYRFKMTGSGTETAKRKNLYAVVFEPFRFSIVSFIDSENFHRAFGFYRVDHVGGDLQLWMTEKVKEGFEVWRWDGEQIAQYRPATETIGGEGVM